MILKLQAELRSKSNGSAKRKLRQEKKVPAVVYGKMTKPVSIALEEKSLQKALHNPNALIELEAPGLKKLVVIHSVDRDPIHRGILAVDLHQINLKERIKVHVRIEPIPDPDGKMIPYQMFLHEIHVDCLPEQIPEAIALDLTPVREGRAIFVKDLDIPEGVHVLTRSDEVIAAPFHTIYEAEAVAEPAVAAAE
ncbi:50S ribosomal protein L25 [Paenibacillus sp. UNC451MF]|uniref:50S ribosomal protein L25 n=1 Tax=Paenibacillus sp. UNC451MF TaxID=1449063 RepID=UPI00048F8983|nr:50S ribosomal protein L25 [Paenibacillus sp. UNC451MF]